MLTDSVGNEHFGVRPYPLLVTGWIASSGVILNFIVQADFEVKYNKIYLEKAKEYYFNPSDVKITEQMHEIILSLGVRLPPYASPKRETVAPVINPTILGDVIRKQREMAEKSASVSLPKLQESVTNLTKKIESSLEIDKARFEKLQQILGKNTGFSPLTNNVSSKGV